MRGSAYVVEYGLMALLGLLITLFAARSVSPEMFGLFAFVLALVSLQQPLAVFGFATLLYGRGASRPIVPSRLMGSALIISFAIGAGFYGITLATFVALEKSDLTVLYALAGLRIIAAFGTILVAIYQSRSDVVGYIPIRTAVLSGAILAVVVAYILDAGLIVYAAIWGAEPFILSFILLVVSLKRRVFASARHPRFSGLLAKASPLAIQSICVALYYRFDQIYLEFRFGEASLAIYAAAARLAEVGNLAFTVLVLVVTPGIIAKWRKTRQFDRLAYAVMIFMVASAVVASVFSMLVGAPILSILFGAGYEEGKLILTIYVLSTCLIGLGTIASRINAAMGRTKVAIQSGLAGAGSNVILTIILCDVYGPPGAAIATVASYALAALIFFYPLISKK